MSAATNLREAATAIADAAPEVHKPATLAAALVVALKDLTVIEPARTADLGTYSYKYADLADIVKKTRRPLADNGIVALTPLTFLGDHPAVSVVLVHESGDSMSFGPFPFQHGRDAQATGSMVTYMRRYALVAALGMAAGDDDDGANAQARQAQPVAETPGFLRSIIAATEGLNEAERGLLRDWLKEQGLPDRPSKMNEEQANRVCDWILNGLPKVDAEGVGDGS